MKTRLLDDGDTAGYLDGEKLVRLQNGVEKKKDNTHCEVGQNGKIVRIFKEEVKKEVKKVVKNKTEKKDK